MTNRFRLMRVSWSEHGALCALVREKVFIYEMRLSREDERDGRDGDCQHVLAISDEGDAIGTGRIESNGLIGRIAVLMPWRQCGVGAAILNELICIARDRYASEVTISAPLFAVDFYRHQQFECWGGVYMEAGIPHQGMRLTLPSAPPALFFSQSFSHVV